MASYSDLKTAIKGFSTYGVNKSNPPTLQYTITGDPTITAINQYENHSKLAAARIQEQLHEELNPTDPYNRASLIIANIPSFIREKDLLGTDQNANTPLYKGLTDVITTLFPDKNDYQQKELFTHMYKGLIGTIQAATYATATPEMKGVLMETGALSQEAVLLLGLNSNPVLPQTRVLGVQPAIKKRFRRVAKGAKKS